MEIPTEIYEKFSYTFLKREIIRLIKLEEGETKNFEYDTSPLIVETEYSFIIISHGNYNGTINFKKQVLECLEYVRKIGTKDSLICTCYGDTVAEKNPDIADYIIKVDNIVTSHVVKRKEAQILTLGEIKEEDYGEFWKAVRKYERSSRRKSRR